MLSISQNSDKSTEMNLIKPIMMKSRVRKQSKSRPRLVNFPKSIMDIKTRPTTQPTKNRAKSI